MLSDIPSGTSCIVDANVLYYHLVSYPGLSEECTTLLARGAEGSVSLVVPAVALAEAVHKVMLAEAAAKFDLPLRGLAHRLNRHREWISQLEAHEEVLPAAKAAQAETLPVTGEHIELATQLSVRHRLLTNDAICSPLPILRASSISLPMTMTSMLSLA